MGAALKLQITVTGHFVKKIECLEGGMVFLAVLQNLCTECGKKLSDAEMIMDRFDSVSRKIPILKRQLDSLQVGAVWQALSL